MKTRVLYVERKPVSSPSIERVFREVASHLPADEFEASFQSVPYGDGALDLMRNLLFFRRTKADIYHVTGHCHYISLRLPSNRTVLTIHDLIILHIRKGIRRWVLDKLYLQWPVRRLRHVTAISQFTKDEIEQFSRRSDVAVIEDPLIGGFDPEPRKLFNADTPVILHVGTAPNKNLPNLIKAVTGLKCVLRIIGKLTEEIRRDLHLAGVDYENVADLGQDAMTTEYRNCDIVSFCSTYEGFGLPIIEAQAMKKPLITSDIEPMRSISGAGALHVDPNDPAAIRSGIERLISDERLREQLILEGKENIVRFDAKSLARKYADIYRNIMAEVNPV
ncbi:MAG: glycosyltransferase family 4 protein [Pyrinomonadaceae bacterium]